MCLQSLPPKRSCCLGQRPGSQAVRRCCRSRMRNHHSTLLLRGSKRIVRVCCLSERLPEYPLHMVKTSPSWPQPSQRKTAPTMQARAVGSPVPNLADGAGRIPCPKQEDQPQRRASLASIAVRIIPLGASVAFAWPMPPEPGYPSIAPPPLALLHLATTGRAGRHRWGLRAWEHKLAVYHRFPHRSATSTGMCLHYSRWPKGKCYQSVTDPFCRGRAEQETAPIVSDRGGRFVGGAHGRFSAVSRHDVAGQ